MARVALALVLLAAVPAAAQPAPSRAEGPHYPSNREPLAPSAFIPLPVGAVRPSGWLRDQLVIQANGLTGHLDEFWPDLGPDSGWKGGKGENWERGPYYLDGLVPLAYILDDPRLIAKVKPWIEFILGSGRPDGWFGPPRPPDKKDRWPLAVAMKVLTQYHEATGDPRALDVVRNFMRYLAEQPPDWPENEWRGRRAGEHVVSALWLYNRTGDPNALQAARSIFENSVDWAGYFRTFPYKGNIHDVGGKPGHDSHVVNVAMAFKYPGLRYVVTKDEAFKQAVFEGIRNLDQFHGQAGGRFAGDEHLSGRRPTQGTELCGVVESMFSLEQLIAHLGDPAFGDRLEMLAYNANPGACTPDAWAHQYDQQANQVLCNVAKRRWATNDDTSNVYGVEPNYGCCTSNMHQGWPKFVSHMWMATPDGGLAAIAYGPCEVKAKVGADGTEVTMTEVTDYPFEGRVSLTIHCPKPVAFPLAVRMPAWGSAQIIVDKKTDPGSVNSQVLLSQVPGTFQSITRTWSDGDVVHLTLPMALRAETRHNGAVSLLRGPLYYSLKIRERYSQIPKAEKGHFRFSQYPHADWEIHPASPWNYGLVLDREHPEKSVDVVTRPVSSIPFAQSTAPVVLKAKARRIPAWGMDQNSAGETPASPAETDQPVEDVELIPYGCTRLRITEFPTVKP